MHSSKFFETKSMSKILLTTNFMFLNKILLQFYAFRKPAVFYWLIADLFYMYIIIIGIITSL